MKIEFTNLAGNLGRDLIRKIYREAYKLEATTVIVRKGRYNRYAEVYLGCDDGIIEEHYIVSL